MPNEILLVEDSDVDAMIFERALRHIGSTDTTVVRKNNGEDALEYIHGTDTTPTIIFLDLNMPIMNGFEFLEERTQSPELSRIPVIVYSSSNNKIEIDRCHSLSASEFIVKPVEYASLLEKLRSFESYWSD